MCMDVYYGRFCEDKVIVENVIQVEKLSYGERDANYLDGRACVWRPITRDEIAGCTSTYLVIFFSENQRRWCCFKRRIIIKSLSSSDSET